MTDERLDKLATYFIHFQVYERYGITFEEFVRRVEAGVWEANMAEIERR